MKPYALVLFFCCCCAVQPDQRVIARVNGEKIRIGDLRAILKEFHDPEIFSHPEAVATLKKQALETLIEEKILLQQAKQRGIEVGRDETRDALMKLKSGYSEEVFQQTLREKGLNETQWEEKQHKKLMIDKLIEQLLNASRPTDAHLETLYQTHRERYREPERSHCRQIVTASRAKAEKILSLLKTGENFAALAQKYSESPDREKGGDLGFVAKNELPPMMDEACFRFAPGQTSGVVASAYGFHIFRIIEKKPAHSLSFQEARPWIENEWKENHREELLRQWMEERYRQSKIEIDEKVLDSTPWPS